MNEHAMQLEDQRRLKLAWARSRGGSGAAEGASTTEAYSSSTRLEAATLQSQTRFAGDHPSEWGGNGTSALFK